MITVTNMLQNAAKAESHLHVQDLMTDPPKADRAKADLIVNHPKVDQMKADLMCKEFVCIHFSLLLPNADRKFKVESQFSSKAKKRLSAQL